MSIETHITDASARLSLPKGFANSTVLIEQLSDTELRIRKIISEDDLPFTEEMSKPLSDRDRDLFLRLLDNPPPANAALRRLMGRSSK